MAAPTWLREVLVEARDACDPARAVAAARRRLAARLDGRRVVAIAAGKAAAAMARGAEAVAPVARGVLVVPGPAPTARAEAPKDLSPGDAWRVLRAGHPAPDEGSLAAGAAVTEALAAAGPDDAVLALLSGGASALLEAPAAGLALDDLARVAAAVMAAGASIETLNLVRGALSDLKAGGLARRCAAPIVTLAISDVPGDALEVIGSGPTVPPAARGPGGAPAAVGARRARAAAALAALGVVPSPAVAAVLAAPAPPHPARPGDHAEVVLARGAFAAAAAAALAARGRIVSRSAPLDAALDGDADAVADVIDAAVARLEAGGACWIGFGEPTVRLPPGHGAGGRAQHLALLLAARWRGAPRWALVVGSDGVDGVAPPGRPPVAGAFVDGGTWDALVAAGADPGAALARRAAYDALAAAGAHVVLGPTGINHADLVIAGAGPPR